MWKFGDTKFGDTIPKIAADLRSFGGSFGGSFGDTISKDAADPFGQRGIVSPKLRRRAPARYRGRPDFRRRRRNEIWVWHLVIAAILTAIAYAFLPHRAAAERLAAERAAVAERLVGNAKVVSGDTLEVGGRLVHLQGIAAPEMDQTCRDAAGKDYNCGHAAMKRLFLYVGADEVRCEVVDPGPGGRPPTGHLIARCEVKSYFRKTRNGATRGEWFDVARELVLTGFVLAHPKYGARYALDETRARGAREGLWAGTFENPWEWRKRGR